MDEQSSRIETDASAPRRWELAELALAYRARIVAGGMRAYPRLSRDRVEELYDKIWERATQPAGEPAAFPEQTYEKLEPWLRAALFNELRHEVNDRHSHTRRVGDPRVLDGEVDPGSDPAQVVEHRNNLSELVQEATETVSERTRTYISMTRIDGMSRAEFRARTGWNQKRIQRARDEWAAFAARMRDGAAAFTPLAWLKRLFTSGGGEAAGGVLSGKAVLATCGAVAVCAGGAATAVEVSRHHDRLSHAARQSSTRVIPSSNMGVGGVGLPGPRAQAARASSKKSKAKSDDGKDGRPDKRKSVEREFGPQSLPQAAPVSGSSGSSPGSTGSSGGGAQSGSSSSFSGEFAP